MVVPNFADKRGLDLISDPSNQIFIFFISSLIYLLLSFLIVSKIKVKLNEINWDEVLNQLREEVKKEDEEFLNKLNNSLKNMNDSGWKYPPPMK
jgi:hypothetical protein